ncbi:sensor histidine kinase [Cryptosporangium minutisporangium]|uniref:sensor histidine kinase n=1 Tax=Cryptosporangium minutisporangium TaxID=113569 RepID=UPI0031E6CA43
MPRAVLPVPGQTGRAVLAGLVAAVLVLVCGAPYWREHVLAAALICAGCAGFGAAGGLLVGSDDSRRRTGVLLLLGSVCGSLAWLASWNTGIWPMISFYGQGALYVLAGCAVLLYPSRRPTGRPERAWVVYGIVVLIVGQLAVQAVSRPEWNGLDPDVVWPNVASERWIFDTTILVVIGGQLVLVVWYLVLLVRRARLLSGLERPGVLPVLLATGVTGGAAAVLTVQNDAWTNLDALLSFYVLFDTIAIAIPLAVLSGALRERWREVEAPNRVVRMTSMTTSVATVRDALASALRDPTLELLFWAPAEQSYVDRAGRLVSRPIDRPTTTGRWWVEARTDERLPLALVALDEALRLRPAMVDAVLRAGSQALLTAQLQAVATAHLKQVLAAQARVEERETAERQRLENDLREGAQRQLVALSARLDRLAAGGGGLPEAVRTVAVSCRDEVRETIDDLRALARGLHPPVLRTDGLGAALDAVAERLGLTVDLAVHTGRQSSAVEATAYFALCEGLTNVAKYAPDARVRIEVVEADGWLHGTVADDGPGGARVVPGGGLAGIAERIRALHGWSVVESSVGAGTRLRVSLPCD